MMRIAIGSLLLVCLAACTPQVQDLRLEQVRPLSSSDRIERPIDGLPWPQDGILVELSTGADLRRLMPATGFQTFFPHALRCSEVGGPGAALDDAAARIATGSLSDSIGSLPPSTSDRPSSVPPRSDGRFIYSLPIARLSYAREQPRAAADFERNPGIFHDLRRDEEDICIYGRGWMFLQGVWRTNIVTVPYSAIRAALDGRSTGR